MLRLWENSADNIVMLPILVYKLFCARFSTLLGRCMTANFRYRVSISRPKIYSLISNYLLFIAFVGTDGLTSPGLPQCTLMYSIPDGLNLWPEPVQTLLITVARISSSQASTYAPSLTERIYTALPQSDDCRLVAFGRRTYMYIHLLSSWDTVSDDKFYGSRTSALEQSSSRTSSAQH